MTAEHADLSALICDVGIMGGPFLLTAQGFERRMASNHLGHAALVTARRGNSGIVERCGAQTSAVAAE